MNTINSTLPGGFFVLAQDQRRTSLRIDGRRLHERKILRDGRKGNGCGESYIGPHYRGFIGDYHGFEN